MRRHSFMHLLNNPLEKVSHPSRWILLWFTTAVTLSVISCIHTDNNQKTQAHQSYPESTELAEWDIDNPIFISLVGISAELQSELEYNPEKRSLDYIWQSTSNRLKEIGIDKKVSVRLVSAQETWRGFSYVVIECSGQEAYISARSKSIALMRTREMQDAYIEHVTGRLQLLLWDRPATKEQLTMILADEEEGLKCHNMFISLKEDKKESWIISFEAEM